MISLQFITHRTERYSYFESARMALEGGCKWIQLRMKDAPLDEVEAVALQLKPLCKEHEAILILDDHVELAKKLEVDGVHLGKKDKQFFRKRLRSLYHWRHSQYVRGCPTALSCRSRLPRYRSFPLYNDQAESEPCSGLGRLCLYPRANAGGTYRAAGSSYRRNHLRRYSRHTTHGSERHCPIGNDSPGKRSGRRNKKDFK